MCGIAGIYNLTNNPIVPTDIERQIETLLHRGPDQGAVFISTRRQCGLGIRRLRIIDVAGGDQPLSNEDQSIHLVYNGETYNHVELRRILEALGHRLRTGNDGEVVLHGYEAWGAAGVLQQLRGMGAFALWDETKQQLFLGRDRFGIKPLYYAQHAGRFYFASEIKAILAQPDFPRQVNVAALDALFRLGFVPGEETMFTHIKRLPPAHYLLASASQIEIKPYWRLQFTAENHTLSLDEAAEQFLTLLTESVKLRLMSEVPLGSLLSGGIDSSTIVALAQANISQQLKTVSIGFQNTAYNEASQAQSLAQTIDTDHHQIQFDDRSFSDYLQIIDHLEEPDSWATSIPIYQLYRACREVGLTVVLTGEGADELLGGYHWHVGDRLMQRLLWLPAQLRTLLAQSPLPISPPARRVLRQGSNNIIERYQTWLAIEDGGFHASLFTPDVVASLREQSMNRLLTNWEAYLPNRHADPFGQMIELQTQTRLPGYINTQVDRLSMAHSIEARVPFLDHKLWEFCATLRPEYKLRGRQEKRLLRHATRNQLPIATRTRQKQGLATPYAHWLQGKILPTWAEEALSSSSLKRAGLFVPEIVSQIRHIHQVTLQSHKQSPNLAPLLMGILNVQLWVDRFLNR